MPPYFIEEVYDKNCLHSALNYCTPNEFEGLLFMQQKKEGSYQTLLTFSVPAIRMQSKAISVCPTCSVKIFGDVDFVVG
jgi:hypothetical protein